MVDGMFSKFVCTPQSSDTFSGRPPRPSNREALHGSDIRTVQGLDELDTVPQNSVCGLAAARGKGYLCPCHLETVGSLFVLFGTGCGIDSGKLGLEPAYIGRGFTCIDFFC